MYVYCHEYGKGEHLRTVLQTMPSPKNCREDVKPEHIHGWMDVRSSTPLLLLDPEICDLIYCYTKTNRTKPSNYL